MAGRRIQPGFTLIELILVLVIIGALLAIVAPSLGRMRSRTRVDDAAYQLRSMVELARARAAMDGKPTRLVVDTRDHLAWIEQLDGGGFARPSASFGAKVELDPGVGIESESVSPDDAAWIIVRVEPDGRAEVAQLTVYGKTGDRERVVYTRTPTEPYRVGSESDAAPYGSGVGLAR